VKVDGIEEKLDETLGQHSLLYQIQKSKSTKRLKPDSDSESDDEPPPKKRNSVSATAINTVHSLSSWNFHTSIVFMLAAAAGIIVFQNVTYTVWPVIMRDYFNREEEIDLSIG
jgi:hypothetical protein